MATANAAFLVYAPSPPRAPTSKPPRAGGCHPSGLDVGGGSHPTYPPHVRAACAAQVVPATGALFITRRTTPPPDGAPGGCSAGRATVQAAPPPPSHLPPSRRRGYPPKGTLSTRHPLPRPMGTLCSLCPRHRATNPPVKNKKLFPSCHSSVPLHADDIMPHRPTQQTLPHFSRLSVHKEEQRQHHLRPLEACQKSFTDCARFPGVPLQTHHRTSHSPIHQKTPRRAGLKVHATEQKHHLLQPGSRVSFARADRLRIRAG